MIGKAGFFMLFLAFIVVFQVFVEKVEADNSLETACESGEGNKDCKETCRETKYKKSKKCYCTGACNKKSKCVCKRPKCKCQVDSGESNSSE